MRYIKKLIPLSVLKFIRPYYHGLLAILANIYFSRPSEKLIVIGVTGTNGKSTTVNLVAAILNEAGLKAGFNSTVNWDLGLGAELNKTKITMPSGWLLQKRMKAMLNNGCKYAVLEVSSEGLAQNRHLGINFDVAVFTNLTPEHLEAHSGFENYKKAKGKLFKELGIRNKELGRKQIQKIIITNADDEFAPYYANFRADKKISYGVNNRADFQASSITYSPDGIGYNLQLTTYNLSLKGQFDVYNSLASVATAASQNISLEICKKALEKVGVVPGRVEVLQKEPFTVVVDYAYEPEEMRQLYETVARWPHKKIVQVLGPCGGGRDSARISVLGEMAAKFSQAVIVTTDDPYDDDPKAIGEEMKAAADKAAVISGSKVFMELDRKLAIAKAFSLAEPGDLVLITGKGADQKMALANGKYADWDDREIAKVELNKL